MVFCLFLTADEAYLEVYLAVFKFSCFVKLTVCVVSIILFIFTPVIFIDRKLTLSFRKQKWKTEPF